MTKKHIFFILMICSQAASAQYYAVGEMTGYVKAGIGKILPAFSKEIEPHKIHAVKHEDGKMYKMKRIYADSIVTVTATNECLIRPKEEYPIYLGRTSEGAFEELKVEYIKFRCTKQSG
ncbi:MAG: hypothetical protein RL755_1635 [Pseudomonadota bacterium]|jgi:hypothetical protein